MSTSASTSEPTTQPQEPHYDETMMDNPESPPSPSHANQNQPLSSQQSNSSQQRTRDNGDGRTSHGAPGSAWNTKKFGEEYDRAMQQVIHQNWDPTRYGDVLLEQ